MRIKFFLPFLALFSTSQFADASPRSDAIRQKISENLQHFQSCYNAALKKDPTLQGHIDLSWESDDKGRVQKALIKKSTMKSEAFEKCMLSRLRQIEFPAAPAGQVFNVTYPFSFSKSPPEK